MHRCSRLTGALALVSLFSLGCATGDAPAEPIAVGPDSFVLTTPNAKSVRVTRGFDAPIDVVWRAHADAELLKQWLTGPPGNTMPVCEIDLRTGGRARYVWKNDSFELGMTADFLEVEAPHRIHYTEEYDNWPEGASTVKTRFVEAGAQTSIVVDIEFASEAAQESVMQPSYAEGFAASYTSLDTLLEKIRG